MPARAFRITSLAAVLAATACSGSEDRASADDATVRWLRPSEASPRGSAPNATRRLLAAHPGGSREFVVVLASGDEVMTALRDVAKAERIGNARFTAIGAVREPEVAWFDMSRKQYKAMKLHAQTEILSLAGGIALGEDGAPVVHAHAVLGLDDGETFGGHMIGATASPTLEVYLTAYPQPLHKRKDPATDAHLIDLAASR